MAFILGRGGNGIYLRSVAVYLRSGPIDAFTLVGGSGSASRCGGGRPSGFAGFPLADGPVGDARIGAIRALRLAGTHDAVEHPVGHVAN